MSAIFGEPHYEAIAQALCEAKEGNPLDLIDFNVVVEALADLFERDDPRFDRKRFEAACDDWEEQ
jgi:hypothetical protein